MPGGAASYRKGAAHERRVASFLRDKGALVVRSPQSGQEMDLTVLWPCPEKYLERGWLEHTPHPWLVQCKTNGYMRPKERAELIALAGRYGCVPILAGPGTMLKDLLSGSVIELGQSDEGTAGTG